MYLIYNEITGFKRASGTASFPLAGSAHRRCGSIFSACLALLFLSTGHASAATTTAQIETRIATYMQQAISNEARQQGWKNVRHTLQIIHIGKIEQLSPCTQPLQIKSESNSDITARMRLKLICPDTPGWSHSVFAQASLFLPAVHASTQIDRGTTLSNGQLTLEETELSKTSRGFFQGIDAVSGQGAKRRIRAGQLITPSLLSAPLMIRRGEAVTIRANHDGISAATKGQAMGNGRAGEVIRVRNLSSEKVIEAQVLEPGVVNSTFR